MFVRTLVLMGGLSGAFGAAQFPEYAQQYTQRLGGAVDALAVVVAEFDASAASVGLTREAALQQLQGTDFLERRRADMERSFARHAQLRSDLDTLESLGPFMRAYNVAHMTDPEIARGTWAAFRPALPLNVAGGIFALFGFTVCATALSTAIALLRPRSRRQAMPA